MVEQRSYELKNFTTDQFEAELDSLWAQIQRDPNIQQQLREAGVTEQELEEMRRRPRTDCIQVRQQTAGFAGAEILIEFLVGVAVAVFDRFVLGRLKIGRSADSVTRVDKK